MRLNRPRKPVTKGSICNVVNRAFPRCGRILEGACGGAAPRLNAAENQRPLRKVLVREKCGGAFAATRQRRRCRAPACWDSSPINALPRYHLNRPAPRRAEGRAKSKIRLVA